MPRAAAVSYYAVRVGRRPGVYRTWAECKAQTERFPGAVHKKFPRLADAQAFSGQPASSSTEPYSVRRPESSVRRPESSGAGPERRAPLAPPPPAGETPDDTVVYTDGASSRNGQHGARAGVGVYFGCGDARNVAERLEGPRQTNQRAELTAIVRALQIADPAKRLHICTDSVYSIKCLTEWFPKWERQGWRNSAGAPVENKDLVQDALDLIRGRAGRTRFTHVRGHSGVPGNEAADRLAVAGSLQEEP
ncbi:hypothetical protein IWQ56_002292 [Coemansia nantahalensis]|uniref:Uncharacterized protein n=2 Tax=Coemansia TaxID=4863 RepID=A0ACC1LBI2_9FUNG|nr:hypothetical protein IWQ57_003555 [Coemansia nantahalensis]KAJ2770106.1 hypothetical protein IWQ56_002292 [Coemansia nantahalensis]KAJ2805333.1 hypothetical protein H4R21_001299 [Coemansia helicoidea]